MTEGLLALALGAGMVAAVNPCGFALLPAYLSLVVLGDGPGSRRAAVGRALLLTAALTLGFVAVFGVFGLVIAPAAAGVQRYLPWVTVVLGLLLVLPGAWLLAGRTLPTIGWSPRGPGLTRRLASMIGFGAAYALASLTCTIGPFLAIVVASFRAGSPAAGGALFVAYAVGMGLMVGAAAVAVALARASLITRLRRAGRWVPRVAGVLMIMVGAYVAYYGWWEIRVLDGAAAEDPVVGAAAQIQGWLAGAVTALGPVGLLAILAGLSALAVVVQRRRGARPLSTARKSQRGQIPPG
ncbi:MAG TPA: cytochrome c biogenesis protein CcdA, partial [Propionibacteriaceae bacterium]|nr:cytochrome c biogenesis protein CcdA [Propionibacteriaceae bacterium]